MFKVSWIRKKDSPPTILTVGVGTYIADDRILIEHARHLQNWGLVIKHVKPEDEGLYECQVSTHPTTSIFIQLKVTGWSNKYFHIIHIITFKHTSSRKKCITNIKVN